VTITPSTSAASPAAGTALSADLFRQAMGRHAAGVVIVTLTGRSGPSGLTVTSFSSASLDPPLVSFYIGHTSSNWPAIRDADHFAVNLIGEGHQALAHRFALKGEDRFAPPTRWNHGPQGLPLLSDATTHLICQTESLVTVGDHELVVGLVLDAVFASGDRPLLHHQGRFTRPEACRQRVSRRDPRPVSRRSGDGGSA